MLWMHVKFNSAFPCMRRTTGCTWTGYGTNAHIAKELKITPILDILLEYKRSWIQHANRKPGNRLPRVMKRYSPTGRRNYGRTLKRLLDTWDRNGSTSGSNANRYDDDDDDDDDDDGFNKWHWRKFHKTNAQIAKELKITPFLDKLLEYKRSWIQHVNRMPRNRLPRVMKHYSPTGRRN